MAWRLRCFATPLASGTYTPVHAARRLVLPPQNRVCKSFQLCHNSQGVAWTSIEVFSALEPLFQELQLPGELNDYVDVVALDGFADLGCACSTPVEVQLSLPLHAGGNADVLLDAVSAFVAQGMTSAMSSVICTTPLKGVQCQTEDPVLIQQRRRLLRCEPVVMRLSLVRH